MAKMRKHINPNMVIFTLLAIVGIIMFFTSSSPEVKQPMVYSDGDCTTEALSQVEIPANTPNIDLNYTGFKVAFNPEMHQPNYVVWEMTPAKTSGPFSRNYRVGNAKVDFAADPAVEGCASLADYKKSGFDRGHLAPSADMKWNLEAQQQCHLLTNISPQVSQLNSGPWATVEKNTRQWAQKYGRLIIVAGPVLSDHLTRHIGTTPVPVPERFFKAIIAPDHNPPMGIGFVMPNAYTSGGAQACVVSIDEIENITGFDFFKTLPDPIENDIESQAALHKWNP